MFSTKITQAARILQEARHAVALTGAGISTPSGIPDFRSPGTGLWETIDAMEVSSLDGFQRHPQAFYDWIRARAKTMRQAKPNPAHLALAELERRGIIKTLITQNIDGLHVRAGSHNILEVHGSLRTLTCLKCYRQVATESIMDKFLADGEVPRCTCGGVLKPDIVLFGEMLPVQVFYRAQQEAEACDVMLVAGSSLAVAPVSVLPALALRHRAQLIIVNKMATDYDRLARIVLHEDVAEALPQIVAALGK
jgi:NAD-dependent deacetylase